MKEKIKKQIIVIQLGARMHYAVPAILAKEDMLACFYTDIHANHLIFKLIKLLIPQKLLFKKLKRLLGRNLPKEIKKRLVKDQSFLSLIWANNEEKKSEIVLKRVLKDDFIGAYALYTNFINNDIPLIRKAKDKGLKIIHEIFITPNSGLIMLEERKLFPDIEHDNETLDQVKKGIELDLLKWQLSNKILVPSKFCYDNAQKLGASKKKLSLVPYGINKNWFNHVPSPQKGRILFVGLVSLRKGVHYLAEASRILARRGFNYETVVIGPKNVDTNQSIFQGPKYIGQMPRSEIIKEFLLADVFVLPSLAEGMALVHLEAMACGIPVITTENCGSIINNLEEGFIVPIRDPVALADKINEIIEDRNLRNKMSIAGKIKARKYTWENYSKNLLNCVENLDT